MDIEPILKAAEDLLNASIVAHKRAHGGYTPAVRLVCQTDKGNVFVKAGVTPLTAEFIRQEIATYRRQKGDFMPQFIAGDEEAETPILIIEDLSDYIWPPPWTTKGIDQVVEQVERMHGTPTELDGFKELHGPAKGQWEEVAKNPEPFLGLGLASNEWLDETLPILIAREEQCSLQGQALCHFDIRSDNLCITPNGAKIVDWNLACRGNPKLDLGFWLPSLEHEGGPQPEAILPNAPEVAAWVAGFFAARAGLPEIPDAPFVRRVQKEQLSTALPWAIRALGLRPQK